jgi:hypothetical protein
MFVDTKNRLIVTDEVTNVSSDRSQLSRMSEQARAAIGSEVTEGGGVGIREVWRS